MSERLIQIVNKKVYRITRDAGLSDMDRQELNFKLTDAYKMPKVKKDTDPVTILKIGED